MQVRKVLCRPSIGSWKLLLFPVWTSGHDDSQLMYARYLGWLFQYLRLWTHGTVAKQRFQKGTRRRSPQTVHGLSVCDEVEEDD